MKHGLILFVFLSCAACKEAVVVDDTIQISGRFVNEGDGSPVAGSLGILYLYSGNPTDFRYLATAQQDYQGNFSFLLSARPGEQAFLKLVQTYDYGFPSQPEQQLVLSNTMNVDYTVACIPALGVRLQSRWGPAGDSADFTVTNSRWSLTGVSQIYGGTMFLTVPLRGGEKNIVNYRIYRSSSVLRFNDTLTPPCLFKTLSDTLYY